jgi:hypothetical protein
VQDTSSDSSEDCVSTRAVGCVDDAGTLVALSLCEQELMPAMEKVCVCSKTEPTPSPTAVEEEFDISDVAREEPEGEWRADVWGPCVHVRQGHATARDGCRQTRFVTCEDSAGDTISADHCDEQSRPRSAGPCDCPEDARAEPVS